MFGERKAALAAAAIFVPCPGRLHQPAQGKARGDGAGQSSLELKNVSPVFFF